MADTRKGTCEGCRKVRKLSRVKLYYWLCSECLERYGPEPDIEEVRRNAPPPKKYRKAYPCVGGPLDGQHAATDDFYDDGMYAHLATRDGGYFEYNSASHGRAPSMIFVWFEFGKTPRVISAAKR